MEKTLTQVSAPTFSTTLRTLAVGFGLALIPAFPSYAQETVQAVDPRIAAALKEISPARVQANIERLVGFGTPSPPSAQGPGAIAARDRLGAAPGSIQAQTESHSSDCDRWPSRKT